MNLCFTEAVKGFPRYLVTRDGRVLNLPLKYKATFGVVTKPSRILKPQYDKDGYHKVNLTHEKKLKRVSIHRLVADAFIPNPANLPVVNHKNGIKDDNRVENLEWCTRSENDLHKYRVLGMKSPKSKAVLQMKDGKVIAEYPSQRALIPLGFSQGHIGACCRGERKAHKGFEWKFK